MKAVHYGAGARIRQWHRSCRYAVCVSMLLVAACSTEKIRLVGPRAEEIASTIAEQHRQSLGLPPGSKRVEAIRAAWLQAAESSEFVEAIRHQPPNTSEAEWQSALELQGYPLLSDEELLRLAAAKANLLSALSDSDCISYVEAKYAGAGSQSIARRNASLLRISDDDFAVITEAQVHAMVARAKALPSPPFQLPADQLERGLRSLMPVLGRPENVAVLDPILDRDPGSLSATEACRFYRVLYSAQSSLRSGGDLTGLRIFMSYGIAP